MASGSSPSSDLDALLVALESYRGAEGFVGRRVTAAIRRAKYPSVWRPLIRRYVDLLGQSEVETGDDGAAAIAHTVAARLYCDMFCTVVTKKIMMVDIFYLYDATAGRDENEQETRLREVHTVTATKYLVKMSTCAYECVYGRPPDPLDIARAASLLYADLYGEAFDAARVSESEVFRVVEKWFRERVLTIAIREVVAAVPARAWPSFENVAPGIPFLFCSHVYWLWLHLTAANVRRAERDLLTVVYALDTIVYCGDCRSHFLEHRSSYFTDRAGEGEENVRVSRADSPELLLHLHNGVNAQTGSPEMDAAVLSEYEAFWRG